MAPTLTFVHTSPAHIPTFDALLAELAPDITARHVADSSLLSEACAHGHVTPELANRIQDVVREAAAEGDGIVLCTCSSIAPAALGAAEPGRLTVLRVDEPMAREAVARGPRITVAATLQTTLTPTRDLILAAAQLCPDLPVPVLTSPRSGLQAAIAMVRVSEAAPTNRAD
jgi:hypothetical protein